MDKILQVLVAFAILAQQQVVLPHTTKTADVSNQTSQKTKNYQLRLNITKPQVFEIQKKQYNFYTEVVLPIKKAQQAALIQEAERQEAERQKAEESKQPTLQATLGNQFKAPVKRTVVPANDDAFYKLRLCESGGAYNRNSGNGYYGAYQFDIGTWAGYGGYARADLAPPEVQDAKARETQAHRGWSPWPACARKLGLL